MIIRYFSFLLFTLSLSTALAQNWQLQYDGIDDFCNLPTGEELFSDLDVFTFEAWINSSDISNAPIFIGSNSNEILFGISVGGGVAFSTSFITGGLLVFTLPGTFPADGMWHHVACVRTGPGAGQGKIYIDGVDQTDPAFNTPGAAVPLSGSLTFGVGLGNFFLNGVMDDLRIWNVERSQTQINNNKDIQLTGSEPGLIGYWQFNEGSSQTIFDSQTNGTTHDGTLGADGSVASDDPTRTQDPGLPLPVELVSFSSSVNGNIVELSWITGSEINNLGFDVERKTRNSDFTNIGFIAGNGTTTEFSNYSFTDLLAKAGTYYYRLKQIDFDGTSEYSPVIQVEVESIPETFNLEQNYPNPFNPSTTISYTIPEAGFVNLAVYNLLGEKVVELVSENLEGGRHQTIFNAPGLSSGLYIYRLELNSTTGNYNSSKVMSLVK